MEDPPCSPDLAPNDFFLFPEIKFALKRRKFQNIEDIQKKKKCDDSTVSFSTTGVPVMFSTVATSLG
jgi:hypothetical protein